MPRTVQMRVSFQADIAFLSRLAQAIEKDEFMTPEEKQRACHGLSQVSTVFHAVEMRRIESKNKGAA